MNAVIVVAYGVYTAVGFVALSFPIISQDWLADLALYVAGFVAVLGGAVGVGIGLAVLGHNESGSRASFRRHALAYLVSMALALCVLFGVGLASIVSPTFSLLSAIGVLVGSGFVFMLHSMHHRANE